MDLQLPPGYRSLTPLDRQKHANLAVLEAGRAPFSAQLHGIHLLVPEFIHAARHYPVVFAKDSSTGKFVALAVTGLDPGKNLFVRADGSWEPFVYVPAYVRRWPFFTLPVTGRAKPGDAESLICVDEQALGSGAESLFDAEGKGSEAWTRIETLLREMESARAQTERLIETLTTHKLLEPFQAHAFPKEGRDLHLTGMYRVSEDRLNALEGKVLKGMMKRGELSRIYSHLMSLDNFRHLMDRATARPSSQEKS